MAKKRKGVGDLHEVVVEAVVWRDAQRQSRERFDPDDQMILVTYGPVIYESDEAIWVASEHKYTPEMMRHDHSDNQDRTEVLKSAIVKRVQLAKFKLVDEEPEAVPKEPENPTIA